jgi:hypothetical protein
MTQLSLAALAQESGVTIDVARAVQAFGVITRDANRKYQTSDVALLRSAVAGKFMGLGESELFQAVATVRGAATDPGWLYALIHPAGVRLVREGELEEATRAVSPPALFCVVPLR